MANLHGFDAKRVHPATRFEPIPAGKYLAMITASDSKANKAGTGQFLELTFTIVEGQHKNRRLWKRLNLDHPSEAAMKIAHAELSAVCHAIGVLTPEDSADLHNLPLLINIRCVEQKDSGQLTNEIVSYGKADDSTHHPY